MGNSLEFRIERSKQVSNLEFELLQRLYDRRSIAERYTKGEVSLHMHIQQISGAIFCAVYMSRNTFEFTGSMRRNFNNALGQVNKRSEMPMFVWIREKCQEMRPCSSFVRLQSLNTCDMFDAESFQKGISRFGRL